MAATAIAAVLYLLPAVSPFFAPGEGFAAGGTDFVGEVGLITFIGHS